jgi:hypothetical protein
MRHFVFLANAEPTLKNIKRTLIVRLIIFSVGSAFAKNTKWHISPPNQNQNNFFCQSPSHLTRRVCFMQKNTYPTWSCLGPFNGYHSIPKFENGWLWCCRANWELRTQIFQRRKEYDISSQSKCGASTHLCCSGSP